MKAELILVILAALTNHIQAVCDPTVAGYVTCKTTYDAVRNKAGVTRSEFCQAATTFKACAKLVDATCETDAQGTITTDTTALTFNCDCDPAVSGYTTCKTAYDGVRNKADVTRTEFCAAATTFKTCAKNVFVTCETNAQTTINADTTSLKLVDCSVPECDPAVSGYTTCKTTYDGVRNKADVTRTEFCAAATTFKTCVKAVRATCETNAQTTINADTTSLKLVDCSVADCDPAVSGYTTCKTTYDGVRNKANVTRTEFCAAAATFKTCVKAVRATCETNAQTTINADTTSLNLVGCSVTTCDPNFAGYITCKATYDTVRTKPSVTSTEFCQAATAFKLCAKTVLGICETNAQTTITTDTTALKFAACGAAGISISLSLMLLTFVAVLKNYL